MKIEKCHYSFTFKQNTSNYSELPIIFNLFQIKNTTQRGEEQIVYECSIHWNLSNSYNNNESININNNNDIITKITNLFETWYFTVIHQLQMSREVTIMSYIKTSKITNVEELNTLRDEITLYLPNGGSNLTTDNFHLGTNKLLSRYHLNNNYNNNNNNNNNMLSKIFVCEASIGNKYLICIIPTAGGVYIIDELFELYFVHGFDSLLDIYNQGVTLIYGKIQQHLTTSKLYFLVYDIFSLNGESVTLLPLSKRLEKIGEFIQMYRNGIINGRIPTNHPFLLMGKPYVDKKHIKKISDSIQINQFKQRIYKDDKRQHKCSGLLFVNDAPLTTLDSLNDIFCWNYLDQCFIYLTIQYKINRTGISLQCIGTEGYFIDFTLPVIEQDLIQLQRDLMIHYHRGQLSIIGSFMFQHTIGKWHYKGIVRDRSRPSTIHEVMQTFQILCENIPIEEIIFKNIVENKEEWNTIYAKSLHSIVEKVTIK